MKKDGYDYILADDQERLKEAYAFLIKNKVPIYDTLSFPTVLATRETTGEIIGILGTSTSTDRGIVAEPLFISIKNPMVTLRVVQVYEDFMTRMGISSFAFDVPMDATGWLSSVRNSGAYVETGEREGYFEFKRMLK